MNLIEPIELTIEDSNEPGLRIPQGLWTLLNAARDGNLAVVDRILTARPDVVDMQFWYTSPLQLAVRGGHFNVVKYLVDKDADIANQLTLHGEESLLQMAEDREYDDIVSYLRPLFREVLNSEGDSVSIHQACEEGDIDKVRQELDADPELLERGDSVGRKPLHYAVQAQNYELVDLLLDRRANINATGFSSDNRLGGFGFTPLALSLWWHQYWRQRNNYEMAKKLVERGAIYNITIAAALGDTDTVKLMLADDPGLANFHDSCGKRPLSAASERNHLDIVKMLLDAGALPNLPDGPMAPHGYALWATARFGFKEVAQLLLENGADPNADVESSGNPTESAKDLEMRSLLYTYGGRQRLSSHFHQGNTDTIAALLYFNPELFDELVATVAFTHCASSHHEDLLKLMLHAGLRVPHTVTYCQSYFWHHLDMARILLEHDMDPDLPNWQCVRPLHYMGQKGQIDAAKLFLEFGATPNLIDDEYRTTPLGWAAKHGQTEFVSFWLERFPDSKTERPEDMPDWATPLAWAKKRNHPEIVEMLS